MLAPVFLEGGKREGPEWLLVGGAKREKVAGKFRSRKQRLAVLHPGAAQKVVTLG